MKCSCGKAKCTCGKMAPKTMKGSKVIKVKGK